MLHPWGARRELTLWAPSPRRAPGQRQVRGAALRSGIGTHILFPSSQPDRDTEGPWSQAGQCPPAVLCLLHCGSMCRLQCSQTVHLLRWRVHGVCQAPRRRGDHPRQGLSVRVGWLPLTGAVPGARMERGARPVFCKWSWELGPSSVWMVRRARPVFCSWS